MVEYSGTGNPGWTFTKERMTQIAIMFKFLDKKNPQEEFNYKKFQNEIDTDSTKLDGSKVRMFSPWFTRFGIFNKTNQVKFYGELFTELGKRFSEFVLLYDVVKNGDGEYSPEQIKTVDTMFRAFMYEFFKNLCKSDKGDLYIELKRWLAELGFLSKKEFFILTTKIKNSYSDEWFRGQIKEYRNNEISIDLKNIKDRNAFGYIIPFCIEAGVVRWDNREDKITPAYDINFEGVTEDGR